MKSPTELGRLNTCRYLHIPL